MRIHRSIREPIRIGLTWDQLWAGEDNGLIACWERGREKAVSDPGLAEVAKAGRLMPLGWKGGVETSLKSKQKYGTLMYLAMWMGIRGEDLEIDTTREVEKICATTGVKVIFTSDASKYADA